MRGQDGPLLAAVCEFTNPYREDGGTVPSLWDQVLAGVTRQGGGAGGKPSSRPPVTSGQLSLVADVERTCLVELAINRDTVSHTRTGERDIPDELRRIEFHLRPYPNVAQHWADKVREWCGQARDLLGLHVRRLNLPRGTRCLACDEAWIDRVTDDGELVKDPAVVLLWTEQGGADRFVCLVCHHESPAYDLLTLSDHQRCSDRPCGHAATRRDTMRRIAPQCTSVSQ